MTGRLLVLSSRQLPSQNDSVPRAAVAAASPLEPCSPFSPALRPPSPSSFPPLPPPPSRSPVPPLPSPFPPPSPPSSLALWSRVAPFPFPPRSPFPSPPPSFPSLAALESIWQLEAERLSPISAPATLPPASSSPHPHFSFPPLPLSLFPSPPPSSPSPLPPSPLPPPPPPPLPSPSPLPPPSPSPPPTYPTFSSLSSCGASIHVGVHGGEVHPPPSLFPLPIFPPSPSSSISPPHSSPFLPYPHFLPSPPSPPPPPPSPASFSLAAVEPTIRGPHGGEGSWNRGKRGGQCDDPMWQGGASGRATCQPGIARRKGLAEVGGQVDFPWHARWRKHTRMGPAGPTGHKGARQITVDADVSAWPRGGVIAVASTTPDLNNAEKAIITGGEFWSFLSSTPFEESRPSTSVISLYRHLKHLHSWERHTVRDGFGVVRPFSYFSTCTSLTSSAASPRPTHSEEGWPIQQHHLLYRPLKHSHDGERNAVRDGFGGTVDV
ncbi:unnamed protein product [Closterium sp. NIES-64]|nr:unnamed protein product [Closterium sp. NIES-64]